MNATGAAVLALDASHTVDGQGNPQPMRLTPLRKIPGSRLPGNFQSNSYDNAIGAALATVIGVLIEVPVMLSW
jgi:hypothetical protein